MCSEVHLHCFHILRFSVLSTDLLLVCQWSTVVHHRKVWETQIQELNCDWKPLSPALRHHNRNVSKRIVKKKRKKRLRSLCFHSDFWFVSWMIRVHLHSWPFAFHSVYSPDLPLSIPSILQALIFTDFWVFLQITLNSLGVIRLSQALLHTKLPPCLLSVGCCRWICFHARWEIKPSAETAPVALLGSFINCSLMVLWFAVILLFPLKRSVFAVLSDVHNFPPTLPKRHL